MQGRTPGTPSPGDVATREDLAAALTALRTAAGMSVREVVAASDGLHGTVAGWFSGQHLPTNASFPMFDAVLAACGVTGEDERARWHDAVARARGRRSGRGRRTVTPYRGLESFGEADADWFFGRTALTGSIIGRLAAGARIPGPVVVIGPSGSGKSSVLRAGVVPTLRARGRRVAVTTPAGAVEALAALRAPAGDGTPPGAAVLVVDQFEELWTQEFRPGQRAAVIDAVTDAAADSVSVALALRADFYGNAAAEPALIGSLESPVVVGPMDDEQLREVITAPAAKAGATVDEALVALLIDETRPPGSTTGARPGTLPLLSHALMTTWARSRHKTLTVADYYASGGIGGTIEQSAESVYTALTVPQQHAAQRVFLRLVTIDDEADLVLRRRATRSELSPGTGPATDHDVDTVIGAFVERRLLTVGTDTVEVTHEILLTAWQRLHIWVHENRAGLVVRRQLTEATDIWLASGRDPGALLTGNRLVIMREWSDGVDPAHAVSRAEREFLDACIAEQDARAARERHRYRVLRRFVAALAVVSVIAVCAAAYAGYAQLGADRARTAAMTARNEAMARQIATESEKLRPRDPALAAQMALASYRVAPVLEARSALLDSTAVRSSTRIVGPEGGTKAVPAPGGGWFATATSDGDVRLYATGSVGTSPKPLATLDAYTDTSPPYALDVDATGTLLAVGGQGGAQLWDVSVPASPHRAATLEVPADASVQDLAFTPDGRFLLAGTGASQLLRWDLAAPARPAALPPITVPGTGREVLAVSPDGSLLATGGTQGTLRVWDATDIGGLREPLFEIPPDPASTDSRLALTFSPDGDTLLAGTTARQVERWSVADPRAVAPLPPLTGFGSYVNTVDVSDDGTLVAAGSSDNTIRVWSVPGDQLLGTLPGPAVVTGTRFLPGGHLLLSAGVDGITRLWPFPGPVLGGATDTVFTDPIDGSGTVLLVGAGSHDTGLHLWDIADPDDARRLADLVPRDGDRFTGATDIGSAADGARRLAAAGTATGSVYLWDITDAAAPRELARVPGVVGGIVAIVAFSPDAAVLAVSDQSANTVHLLDVSDPLHPREISATDAANYPQTLAFAPDGRTLAVATADNTVELWDVADPAHPTQRTAITGFKTYAQAAAFSPDGRLLAAGSADQTVREWDVSDIEHPREIGILPDFGGAVYALDYNADGTQLAAATSSGTVRVWDVDGTRMPTIAAKLNAYEGRTFDARFGRDGVLAAAGPGGTVRLWSTDPDAAAAEICSTRGTALTTEEWARYLPGVPRQALCG